MNILECNKLKGLAILSYKTNGIICPTQWVAEIEQDGTPLCIRFRHGRLTIDHDESFECYFAVLVNGGIAEGGGEMTDLELQDILKQFGVSILFRNKERRVVYGTRRPDKRRVL